MSYHIYLVEEHKNLSDLFTFYLKKEGWKVSSFECDKEARQNVEGETIHLWMMDILFSSVDGVKLAKEIKSQSPSAPVIFISDHDRVLDEISANKMEGVFCLPKPFLPRDLVGLIHQLLGNVSGL